VKAANIEGFFKVIYERIVVEGGILMSWYKMIKWKTK
jgi:hypothetical protein